MNARDTKLTVVVRGAGELASGVIHGVFQEGYDVIALEQHSPCCVRRYVCFAEAVYDGQVVVESVKAALIEEIGDAYRLLRERVVPVLVDPGADILNYLNCDILIDGRMLKTGDGISLGLAGLVIGLGPGFIPGTNCHIAVETSRGPDLGAVLTDRLPRRDTGVPSPVDGYTTERVLRAPVDGVIAGRFEIGDFVRKNDIAAEVSGTPVKCEIDGVLRGICRMGLAVIKNQKIGDIDPRGKRELCYKISDKARAIARGVLEGIKLYENAGAPAK
jgi:xanthine dehydrogenase accessory factor